MAKPKYRLQALLRMKEQAEDEAKQAVAAARRRLEQETERLREMRQELANMKEFREEKRAEYDRKMATGEIRPQQMPRVGNYIDGLVADEEAFQEEIDAQVEKVHQAEDDVDEAQAALVEAAKEKKALEKHKEKFIERAMKELSDKEAKRQDEVGQAIYMSQHNS